MLFAQAAVSDWDMVETDSVPQTDATAILMEYWKIQGTMALGDISKSPSYCTVSQCQCFDLYLNHVVCNGVFLIISLP